MSNALEILKNESGVWLTNKTVAKKLNIGTSSANSQLKILRECGFIKYIKVVMLEFNNCPTPLHLYSYEEK